MRYKLIVILIVFITLSCEDDRTTQTNGVVMPFELIVSDYDYSMDYHTQYILTDKELIVIQKSELEPTDSLAASSELQNSVLLDTVLAFSKELQELSYLELDSLKQKYKTKGVHDGTQISVKLTKQNKTKKIHLSNYYHPVIGRIIMFINKLVPKEQQIYYNKEELQDLMNGHK